MRPRSRLRRRKGSGSKLRVVCVAEISLAECAGPAVHLAELCAALRRRGIQVRLVVPRLGRYPGGEPCPTVYVPTVARRGLARPLFHLLLPFYLLPAVWRADVVYTRASYYTILPAVLARMFCRPHVAEVNGLFREDLVSAGRSAFVRCLCALTEKVTYRLSSAIITVTDGIADVLSERFSIPRDRFVVIENGVNPEVFAPGDRMEARAELGLPSDARLAVYVGSIERWQGLDLVLDIAPAVAGAVGDVRFVLVGGGSDEAHLRSRIEAEGLSDLFVLTGPLPPAEAARYIVAADVCLAPFWRSPTAADGRPIAVRSQVKAPAYMCCGRAVAAFDVPGQRFIAEAGAGRLAPPGDAKAYAELLGSMLGDRRGCDAMGARGREYVLANRTWDHTAAGTLDVLRRVAEAGT